jgi:hypothetical protein
MEIGKLKEIVRLCYGNLRFHFVENRNRARAQLHTSRSVHSDVKLLFGNSTGLTAENCHREKNLAGSSGGIREW